MKKIAIILSIMATVLSCNSVNNNTATNSEKSEKPTDKINISVKEFQGKIGQNTIVLDVRTPKEYAQGHLKNSVLANILSPDFNNILPSLDKTKTILVYCRSGNRSARATKILKEKGFKVYNMVGGINAWISKDCEIEK